MGVLRELRPVDNIRQFGWGVKLDADFTLRLRYSMFANKGGQLVNFSRSTTATVIDFEGNVRNCKIDEARFEGARRVENLLPSSEKIESGDWDIGSTTTVTNNDGFVNISFGGNTGTSAITASTTSQVDVSEGEVYVCRIDLRAGTASKLSIKFNYSGAAGESVFIPTTETLTSEWVTYTGSITVPSGATIGKFKFRASGAGDIDVRKFQLEEVTNQNNQNPSEYVSVGAIRDNLYNKSEDVANISFVNLTITTETQNVSGLGYIAADKCLETTTNGAHQVANASSKDGFPQTGVTYNSSVFVKEIPGSQQRYVGLRGFGNGGSRQFPVFDIRAGTIVRQGSNNWTNTQIEDFGGGWYRISGTTTSTTSKNHPIYQFFIDPDPISSESYAGDTSSGFFMWGFQLSESSDRKEFQRVVDGSFIYHGAFTDGVKYFDYENGNTVSNGIVTEAKGSAIPETTLKGYLNEASRTNIIRNSNDLTNAEWSILNNGILSYVQGSYNFGMGTLTTIVTLDSATSSHFFLQDRNLSADKDYTITIIARPNGYNWLQVFPSTGFPQNTWANFDLTNGVIGNKSGNLENKTSISTLNDGFYKITFTGTSNVSGPGRIAIAILDSDKNNRNPAFTGDGTSGIEFAYVGMEQSSFATSPIKTDTTSVTRNADNLTLIPSIVSSDCTLSMEVRTLTSAEFYDDGSTDEFRLFGTDDTNGVNDEIRTFQGTSQYGFTVTGGGGAMKLFDEDFNSASTYKFATSFKQLDSTANIKIVLDGDVKLDQNYSITLDHSDISINIGEWNGIYFSGNYKYFKVWDKGLSNSELEEETK